MPGDPDHARFIGRGDGDSSLHFFDTGSRLACAAPLNAVKAITTIQTAQVQYRALYGRFAGSLQELGPPVSGVEGSSAAGLIERELADGNKGGYNFTLTLTPTGYNISATGPGRAFLSDETLSVHVHEGPQPATISDPTLGK